MLNFATVGSTLQQQGDYSSALNVFSMALQHLPGDAGLLFRIAECQLELDERELARATLQDCLARCTTSTTTPGLYQHALSLIDRIN